MRARQRRHGLLRRRAQGGRHGAARAGDVMAPFPSIAAQWQQIITFLAIASMVLGAFAAIGQTNIKRLMAYSSIGQRGLCARRARRQLRGGHAGRADLHGDLCRHDARRLRLHSVHAPRRQMPLRTSTSWPGLPRTNLPMAFALMILMFSLAGIPPLAGFFAQVFRVPGRHQGRALPAWR